MRTVNVAIFFAFCPCCSCQKIRSQLESRKVRKFVRTERKDVPIATNEQHHEDSFGEAANMVNASFDRDHHGSRRDDYKTRLEELDKLSQRRSGVVIRPHSLKPNGSSTWERSEREPCIQREKYARYTAALEENDCNSVGEIGGGTVFPMSTFYVPSEIYVNVDPNISRSVSSRDAQGKRRIAHVPMALEEYLNDDQFRHEFSLPSGFDCVVMPDVALDLLTSPPQLRKHLETFTKPSRLVIYDSLCGRADELDLLEGLLLDLGFEPIIDDRGEKCQSDASWQKCVEAQECTAASGCRIFQAFHRKSTTLQLGMYPVINFFQSLVHEIAASGFLMGLTLLALVLVIITFCDIMAEDSKT